MPTNLELKIPVKDFESTLSLLKEINAEYCGVLNQKDIYYEIHTGLLKLRLENGNGELIFYNRDEVNKDRFSDFQILKIASLNGEEFLGKLFKAETVVEKKRILYKYDDTRIHLDEVKGLGKYIELETKVHSGKDDAVKRFNNLIKLLELDITTEIKASYKNILDAKLYLS